jgi:hypothetical protein
MRSALLVLVGAHVLLGCGAAPGREPTHDVRPTEIRGAAPRERRPARPVREEPSATGSAAAALRSTDADCAALAPEVQKASRMIEVLRESDLSTPPDALRRIADRLDLWARPAAVRASDPELAERARDLRESFARTGAAVRELRATLEARDIKKASLGRARLERELDRDAKVVRSVASRCKSDPYESIQGKAHIPPHVVRRVVHENFTPMRACYEKGLRRNPRLEGRIPVHLVVDRDGRVTYAGDADRPAADAPLLIALPSPGVTPPSSPAPPLRDEGVVDCVLGVFRGLRFPALADRKSVATVVYPIVFGVDHNRSPAQ